MGECYRSTVKLTVAVSPAFIIDGKLLVISTGTVSFFFIEHTKTVFCIQNTIKVFLKI